MTGEAIIDIAGNIIAANGRRGIVVVDEKEKKGCRVGLIGMSNLSPETVGFEFVLIATVVKLIPELEKGELVALMALTSSAMERVQAKEKAEEEKQKAETPETTEKTETGEKTEAANG